MEIWPDLCFLCIMRVTLFLLTCCIAVPGFSQWPMVLRQDAEEMHLDSIVSLWGVRYTKGVKTRTIVWEESSDGYPAASRKVEESFDPQGRLIFFRQYSYEGDIEIEDSLVYNEELNVRQVFRKGLSGQMTEKTTFYLNADGSSQKVLREGVFFGDSLFESTIFENGIVTEAEIFLEGKSRRLTTERKGRVLTRDFGIYSFVGERKRSIEMYPDGLKKQVFTLDSSGHILREAVRGLGDKPSTRFDYQYDGKGNLVGIKAYHPGEINPFQTTVMTYTARNQVIKELTTQPGGVIVKQMVREYDPHARVLSESVMGKQSHRIQYSYKPDGRITLIRKNEPEKGITFALGVRYNEKGYPEKIDKVDTGGRVKSTGTVSYEYYK